MDSRYPNPADKEKRDEDRRTRKLFIGGVSFSTSDEDFFKYFAKYGELEDCVLIREKDTGQSRGFGFVTYKDKAVSEHVAEQQLYLDGRRLDPKPSISRYNMDQIHGSVHNNQTFLKHRNQTTKVFVGGLHDDTVEAELSEYFNGFGEVMEVNIMYDRFTNAPRGFGFVTFKECDVANKVINWDSDHMIHSKKVDCKPATARKDAFKRNDLEIKDNKSSSREERWRRYHGDTDDVLYAVGDDIHPHHPHHPSYLHSSYAHTHHYPSAPPYPSSYGYAPPHHGYAPAPYPPPHYDAYYRAPPPIHYPSQQQSKSKATKSSADYYPPQYTAQPTYPSAVPHQRYDYYAQYHHHHQQQQTVSSSTTNDNKQSVIAPPNMKPVIDNKQTPITTDYAPQRGSKATNSAKTKRYSAY